MSWERIIKKFQISGDRQNVQSAPDVRIQNILEILKCPSIDVPTPSIFEATGHALHHLMGGTTALRSMIYHAANLLEERRPDIGSAYFAEGSYVANCLEDDLRLLLNLIGEIRHRMEEEIVKAKTEAANQTALTEHQLSRLFHIAQYGKQLTPRELAKVIHLEMVEGNWVLADEFDTGDELADADVLAARVKGLVGRYLQAEGLKEETEEEEEKVARELIAFKHYLDSASPEELARLDQRFAEARVKGRHINEEDLLRRDAYDQQSTDE